MGSRDAYRERLTNYIQGVLREEGSLPSPDRVVSDLKVSRASAYRYLDQAAEEAGLTRPRLIARTDEASRKALVEHVRQGSSVAETARFYGVGENTVRRALAPTNVKPPPPKRRPPSAPAARHRGPRAHGRGRERVLEYVEKMSGLGEDPTEREIAAALGIAPSSVAYHVKRLNEAGLLRSAGGGQVGATLRGEQFLSHCRKLAEAAASDEGIPASQRRLVLAMCMPALAARPQIKSPHLALAVPVAVEFNVCRLGRATTVREISEHFPQSKASAVRWALETAISFGYIRKADIGYTICGPDPMHAAAMRLRGLPRTGWKPDLAERRDAVLRVLLGVEATP